MLIIKCKKIILDADKKKSNKSISLMRNNELIKEKAKSLCEKTKKMFKSVNQKLKW